MFRFLKVKHCFFIDERSNINSELLTWRPQSQQAWNFGIHPGVIALEVTCFAAAEGMPGLIFTSAGTLILGMNYFRYRRYVMILVMIRLFQDRFLLFWRLLQGRSMCRCTKGSAKSRRRIIFWASPREQRSRAANLASSSQRARYSQYRVRDRTE